MTKPEFVAAHFHEIFGMVADAKINDKAGVELSMWLRTVQHRITLELGVMYDELTHKPLPTQPATPANGQVAAKRV